MAPGGAPPVVAPAGATLVVAPGATLVVAPAVVAPAVVGVAPGAMLLGVAARLAPTDCESADAHVGGGRGGALIAVPCVVHVASADGGAAPLAHAPAPHVASPPGAEVV